MKIDINHVLVHELQQDNPSSRAVQVELADLPLALPEGFDDRLRVDVEGFMESELSE